MRGGPADLDPVLLTTAHGRAKVRPMEAKTQKSELSRTAIVGAALELATEKGLEALTLQAVADRIGFSKSGVFSRVGAREALQIAVIEEFGRRFLADVFVPAMARPRGLPRLEAIVRGWFARLQDAQAHAGCLFSAGAFELANREGPLRDLLAGEISRWRTALRRTVQLAIETGELKADTDADQMVGEIYSLALGVIHDVRFLHDANAANRALNTWAKLLSLHRNRST
ncbi:hypothetical protein BURK2_01089 [Burkholderiales bacterium]|nr:hypothetical protein BURK2_01089 [Burkholderiales bacterium]